MDRTIEQHPANPEQQESRNCEQAAHDRAQRGAARTWWEDLFWPTERFDRCWKRVGKRSFDFGLAHSGLSVSDQPGRSSGINARFYYTRKSCDARNPTLLNPAKKSEYERRVRKVLDRSLRLLHGPASLSLSPEAVGNTASPAVSLTRSYFCFKESSLRPHPPRSNDQGNSEVAWSRVYR